MRNVTLRATTVIEGERVEERNFGGQKIDEEYGFSRRRTFIEEISCRRTPRENGPLYTICGRYCLSNGIGVTHVRSDFDPSHQVNY